MRLVAEDMAELIGRGLPYRLGVGLFIGREPAEPADAITLFDTSAEPPLIPLTSPTTYAHSLQVRVRNRRQRAGWEVIQEVSQALHGQAGVVLGGARYISILIQHSPILLDWDENNRCRFIVNLTIKRREEL